jgi:SAM-dependent methyltransferase
MDKKPLDSPEFDFEAVFQVDDYLYFYGDTLSDEITDREVELLVKILDLDHPLKILDLACGHGRHANRLAALGHQVTGLDLTAGFLEIARRDAQQRGVQVDYRQGDMRFLDLGAEFDLILILFTAFGYFEDDENLAVLQNIARALRPHGRFVLDIQNRDGFMKVMLPYIVTEKEGNLMIDRTSFDVQTGRLYNRRIVVRDGVRRDKPFYVRLYSLTEIRDLLHQAGLEIEQVLGSWDGQPISLDSRRMIIIARTYGEDE